MNSHMEKMRLPDTGQPKPVRILEIAVKIGEIVPANTTVLIVESDKATLDVPMPVAGVLTEWKVGVGDLVTTGDILAFFMPEAAQKKPESPVILAPPAPASNNIPQQIKPPDSTPTLPEVSAAKNNIATHLPKHNQNNTDINQANTAKLPPLASPAVRKLARELGVDLLAYHMVGQGKNGRILDIDIKNFVKNTLQNPSHNIPPHQNPVGVLPKVRAVNWADFGEIHIEPASRIRQLTAEHMHHTWLNVPQVTQFDQADITELEKFRLDNTSPENKLSLLPFLMKSVAKILRLYPSFNAAIDIENKQIIQRNYIHIGVAVETPNGLFVPVIRNVEQFGVRELSGKITEVAARARNNKLTPNDLQGGCFSISSLGGIGGGHFTPIVNAPEAAILGVGRAVMQPVWDGTQFVPRLMLPLALSYDHRLLDGAQAARFMVALKAHLEDVRKLLL